MNTDNSSENCDAVAGWVGLFRDASPNGPLQNVVLAASWARSYAKNSFTAAWVAQSATNGIDLVRNNMHDQRKQIFWTFAACHHSHASQDKILRALPKLSPVMKLANTQPHMNHIKLVQEIMENARKLGSLTVAEALSRAQHFSIDLEIFHAAGKFAFQTFMDHEFFVDSIAVPPARPATFRLGDEPSLYIMDYDGDFVSVGQIGVNGVSYRQFIWVPGSNRINARSSFEPQTDKTIFSLHLAAAALGMMLSLLNSPSLVETNVSGQRQERRAANRTHQLPVDAWYQVRWRTAARSEVEHRQSDGKGYRMPLHYRRGHVRKAQSHHAKAFATQLSETGWGQWIDGQWVGHPAFGIKKSIHSPSFDTEGFGEFMRRKTSQFSPPQR